MNFDFLLTNPELAKHIKFEITGENLLELSATLINSTKHSKDMGNKETYITKKDVCALVNRDIDLINEWKKDHPDIPFFEGAIKTNPTNAQPN